MLSITSLSFIKTRDYGVFGVFSLDRRALSIASLSVRQESVEYCKSFRQTGER